ncbi:MULTISPECIES: hypothetical protein [Micrococcus]|uniref:Uncharacterized protein n=1 Tax=Micrococcus terreus TaxID=574650 RepID=A0A1I7MRV3_9MICC|nr:hypothetical protein [Micrococcus terreus]MDK7700061.1 hypothetical protein [Micrococcus terreus]WOO97072.1 hypothetical protein R3I42_11245 [Micrococcus terreus]SFV24589.1 hypothetical protein SAMN04487966_111112 [Micrococcus terreus]
MHPALLMLLVTLVAVLSSLATWWTLRGSGGDRADVGQGGLVLSARERRITAAALVSAAERTEGEATALQEAGFGAAREAMENAREMRELAERLGPPQIERD